MTMIPSISQTTGVKWRAIASPRSTEAHGRSPWWALFFVFALVGFQVSLVLLGGTQLRLPLRIGSYAASIGLIVFAPPRPGAHPSYRVALWVILILIVSFLHPDRNSVAAAVAQIMLYVAVLGPLAWMSGLRFDRSHFRLVVLTLWGFYCASAALGVLQVYNPGRFSGDISINIAENQFYLNTMSVTLASGERVLRPMGLTDVPGGAGIGGLNAILLGFGILLSERSRILRYLAVGGMIVGLFVIYISCVRTNLLMAGLTVIALCVALLRRGNWPAVWTVLLCMIVVALVGTTWAVTVGGDSISDRFMTLLEADPGTVVYDNRGRFLHHTLEFSLFQYPFGAGLGRCGLVSGYFGTNQNLLYSEMMWSSLLYDGGIGLMAAYAIILIVALRVAWRIGTVAAGGWLSVWGAVVFAQTLGGIGASFGYPIFCMQSGMEIWLLNACLFAVWRSSSSGVRGYGQDPSPLHYVARKPMYA
jgi:hypothetical protein